MQKRKVRIPRKAKPAKTPKPKSRALAGRKPRRKTRKLKTPASAPVQVKRKYTRRAKPLVEPQPGPFIVKAPMPSIPPQPWRSIILTRAHQITMGDRNRSYGDPLENFDAIASLKEAFWNAVAKAAISATPPESPVLVGPKFHQNTPFGHAIDMVFNNLGRIASAPTRAAGINIDRFMDGCNYLAIAGEIAYKTWGNPDLENPNEPSAIG